MKSFTPLDDWIREKIGSPKETLERDELEAYQIEKLRETVRRMKTKSSFYAQKLAGIDCDRMKSLKDLARIPFTNAEELRQQHMRMICVSAGEISRIVTLDTSGTTGSSKRIFFTKEDQELTIDYFHHGMRNLVDSSDTELILLPCKTPGSVGDLLRLGLARDGIKTVPYGLVDDVERVLSVMEENQITSLTGNPVQVLHLAREDQKRAENGAGLAGRRMKSILLSTEYIPKETCDEIAAIWNCKVFEHYGMTEMGLGCAVSCSALSGYHIREADLLLEIIDPYTGLPVPDGDYGEIVFSTLTRQAMPFLRYRTGDISRFLVEPCSCGSRLKRIEKVGDRDYKKKLTENKKNHKQEENHE